MIDTVSFETSTEIARIKAAQHEGASWSQVLAEIPDTPQGKAVLQALVLEMADERARTGEQLAALERQRNELAETVSRMEVLVKAKEALIDHLNQGIKALQVLQFGKRSEKLSPAQLALAFEDIVLSNASDEAQIDRIDLEAAGVADDMGVGSAAEKIGPQPITEPNRTRASLPAHLPVVEEVIEPDKRIGRRKDVQDVALMRAEVFDVQITPC
jgi:hypothetical protein